MMPERQNLSISSSVIQINCPLAWKACLLLGRLFYFLQHNLNADRPLYLLWFRHLCPTLQDADFSFPGELKSANPYRFHFRSPVRREECPGYLRRTEGLGGPSLTGDFQNFSADDFRVCAHLSTRFVQAATALCLWAAKEIWRITPRNNKA